MSDINKMNRTWLCSVLFLDIVNYSSQSVELQIKWKDRFNGYLGNAIRDVPEDERVILDTGDGAATLFSRRSGVSHVCGARACGTRCCWMSGTSKFRFGSASASISAR